MREHHDAEEPAESSEAHEQSDENRPPKNAAGVFLFGETPTAIGAVPVAVTQESDLHNRFAKILVFIE
jgi:hypothetical protein